MKRHACWLLFALACSEPDGPRQFGEDSETSDATGADSETDDGALPDVPGDGDPGDGDPGDGDGDPAPDGPPLYGDLISSFVVREIPGDAFASDYRIDAEGRVVAIYRMYRGPFAL